MSGWTVSASDARVSPEIGPQAAPQQQHQVRRSPKHAAANQQGTPTHMGVGLPVPNSQKSNTTPSSMRAGSNDNNTNVSGGGGSNSRGNSNPRQHGISPPNASQQQQINTPPIASTPIGGGAGSVSGGGGGGQQQQQQQQGGSSGTGRSPEMRAGTPQSASGLVFDTETHLEVYNTMQNALLVLPQADIIYLPPNPESDQTGGFKLCPNFDPARPFDSCPQMARCRYVHARTDNAVSHDIHVNYAWGSIEDVCYSCFPPGQVLHVAPPNANVATDEIPSHLVLKTRALQSSRRVISHCAHYYFNRTCNRGSSCYFVHAVSLTPQRDPVSGAEDPTRRIWGRTQQRRPPGSGPPPHGSTPPLAPLRGPHELAQQQQQQQKQQQQQQQRYGGGGSTTSPTDMPSLGGRGAGGGGGPGATSTFSVTAANHPPHGGPLLVNNSSFGSAGGGGGGGNHQMNQNNSNNNNNNQQNAHLSPYAREWDPATQISPFLGFSSVPNNTPIAGAVVANAGSGGSGMMGAQSGSNLSGVGGNNNNNNLHSLIQSPGSQNGDGSGSMHSLPPMMDLPPAQVNSVNNSFMSDGGSNSNNNNNNKGGGTDSAANVQIETQAEAELVDNVMHLTDE